MTTIAMTMPAVTAARSSRWFVLVGALMIQGILGTIYGYSVFWQPLEARLFPPVVVGAPADATPGANADSNVTVAADETEALAIHAARQSNLKYSFGICLFCFAFSMIFSGRLQDTRGPRFVSICGAVCLGLGFLLAGQSMHIATFYCAHAILTGVFVAGALSVYRLVAGRLGAPRSEMMTTLFYGVLAAVVTFAVMLGNRFISGSQDDRLFLLWATIGALAGVGIGFAYVAPIAVLVKWFPRQKGLMAGIAVAGFGFGAYLFSGRSVFGAAGFIERFGIDLFFNVHAILCLGVVFTGALLMQNPPADWARLKGGPAAGRAAPAVDSTWRETIRSLDFYRIWIMFFSGALAGLMVIGILKPFAGSQLVAAAVAAGAELSPDDRSKLLMQGAQAVGWLAIFNALGRIFWGLVADRLGHRVTLTAMFLLQMVMMVMLQTLDSSMSLAVGAAWVGFHFGGNFAIFPALTAERFGTRNLGANYGWVFTSYGTAGLLGVALGNTAIGQTGSYQLAFMISAGMCLLSSLLAMTLRLRKAETVA